MLGQLGTFGQLHADAACGLEVDIVGRHVDVGHVQGLVQAAYAFIALPEGVAAGNGAADFAGVDGGDQVDFAIGVAGAGVQVQARPRDFGGTGSAAVTAGFSG